jgi:hypothetical protein
MNPLFSKLYKHKKKRPRDPNAPPPPTLLGQVKELKDTQAQIELQARQVDTLNSELNLLKSRYRNLEIKVDQLVYLLSKRR